MGSSCLGAGNNHCDGKHPIIWAPSDVCKRTEGGTKTVGVPAYALTVVNEEQPTDGAN